MRKIFSLLIIFCFFQPNVSNGQDTIYLNNPSFEDMPRKGGEPPVPIKGWEDCGLTIFPGESPPDIHPVPTAAWQVSKPPFEGRTYLGLVSRFNNTHESLSQELDMRLKAGSCYSISGYVSVSMTYRSPTPRSINKLENFIRPVRFLIAGGHDMCAVEDILVIVGPVENTDWQQFKIEFTPKENYRFITIGTFYDDPNEEPYNGHVLVDGLSPIIEIECK